MDVDPATAKHSSEHKGKSYYFCCEGCKKKFDADQGALPATEAGPAATGRQAGKLHPCWRERPRSCQCERDVHPPDGPGDPPAGPGHCPICGMALEPEVCSPDAAPTKS
ncbi:MAG: YHS domain-containing protein [Flavobacteriales bacterium]|nr:YHS domain-containing protein [Flavobacteriales bacterium]